MLTPRSSAADRPLIEVFRQELRRLGYLEGGSIAIDVRYADGKIERLTELASELVRLKVDVLVTAGDSGLRIAQQATTTIPIIVMGAGDLVSAGYVASLAHPGGNITGLTYLSPELSRKALELLAESFPRISTVAILWNPTNAAKVLDFQEAKAAAATLRLTLVSLAVRTSGDLERAFQSATRERVDALSVRADAIVTSLHRKRVVELTAQHRLPAIYELREFVDEGGLMSYGPSREEIWRRGAAYVDKILKGAKAADLPVEQPTKFELIINLRTAKALGMTISQSVLMRADQLIE